MRKFFSLIAAVLFAGSMMASVITLDPAEQTPQTTETDISLTIDGIDIAYHGTLNAAGNTTPADFRVYANNSLTLSAEYNITKVVIAGKAQKADFTASVDNGTITTGASYKDVTEKKELSDPLIVIEDINSTSVTLSVFKQLRAYLIEVTVEEPTSRKITLVAGPWNADGAQFAAATLDEVIEDPVMAHLTSATFSDFFVEESEGVFVGEVPYETKMIAFGRFSSNATAPITTLTLMGTDFWNHSDILLLDESQKYTIISMGEGLNVSAKGFWGDDVVSYFLTGTFNNWAAGDVNYLFKENASAEGEWRLNTNIEKGAGVKVVGVHSKYNQPDWYPDGMDNEFVANDVYGDVTVYFRPDGQGGEEWHEGFFRVVPQEEEPGINVTATGLLFVDYSSTEKWWQMYGANAEYQISVSNNESEMAPGTYDFENDLDPEWTYLVPVESETDTIFFVSGSLTLEMEGINATITGSLVAEDGNTYNFNLKGILPHMESEETWVVNDAEFDDTYFEYGLFAVFGNTVNQEYVQFSLWTEGEDHTGTFTEADFDNMYIGTGIYTADNELIDIYTANVKIEATADGYVVKADVLCVNNVLYHITMNVGGGGVDPGELLSCLEVYDLADNAEAALDEVVVTYVSGRYCWVKDETGAMLVYLPFNPATTFAPGDVLTGVVGKKTTFNGLVEVTLTADQLAAVEAEDGDAPEPDELSAIDVDLDMNKYIILKGINMNESKAFTSAGSETAVMNIAGTDVDLFNKFKFVYSFDADKKYDIVGIVSYYKKLQVHFISATEVGGEEGIEDIVATGAAAKVLRDNQILIIKGDKVYNVYGTRVK